MCDADSEVGNRHKSAGATISGVQNHMHQGYRRADPLTMSGVCNEQDDEMLVSMASAHGGSGDDADMRPEQQASDMELLYQVIYIAQV